MSASRDTLVRGGRRSTPSHPDRPRVAFLGLGWIGRARLRALLHSGLADVVALVDPDADARCAAAQEAPGATTVPELAEMRSDELDGLVIATPSAHHAAQALEALHAGIAVFCEKPLGRDLAETAAVVQAARDADRLLTVDLSYRHTRAARAMRALVRGGRLGELQLAELVFHNAYGPDKPWFTDRASSGGGCLIDLGTHLVDLLMWVTGIDDLRVDAASLRRRGRPLASADVEDLALASLSTAAGAPVRLACSWFLPAGCDCRFECSLYGSEGAVSMFNVDGSFYDFGAERRDGTTRTRLVAPGDDWGGGAVLAWARRLGRDRSFDAAAAELIPIAATLQRIYAAGRCGL